MGRTNPSSSRDRSIHRIALSLSGLLSSKAVEVDTSHQLDQQETINSQDSSRLLHSRNYRQKGARSTIDTLLLTELR